MFVRQLAAWFWSSEDRSGLQKNILLRTVKVPEFYSPCKLNWQFHRCWQKTQNSWIRDNGQFITHSKAVCLVPTFVAEGQVIPAHRDCVTENEVWLREPKYFIMDSKHACPLLQKETLSLSSKAIHYINIFFKIVWNKGKSLLLRASKAETWDWRHGEWYCESQ